MATPQLPPNIRVECPNCGFFSSVTLRFAEGGTADYEGVSESELQASGLCGAALLVTVTLLDEVEETEKEEE